MKEELIKVKSSFSVVSKERESLAQEMTKAQFFASDAKLKLDDAHSKVLVISYFYMHLIWC